METMNQGAVSSTASLTHPEIRRARRGHERLSTANLQDVQYKNSPRPSTLQPGVSASAGGDLGRRPRLRSTLTSRVCSLVWRGGRGRAARWLALLTWFGAFAQPATSQDVETDVPTRLSIFLDCDFCDEDVRTPRADLL